MAGRGSIWRLGGLILLAALAVAGWWWTRERGPDGTAPPADDPRLTYATPFLNVRPDVGYVGDEACAACHVTHHDSYRRHPMGRSFAPTARTTGPERLDNTAHNPFDKDGIRFRVERRDGQTFHTVDRPTADGRSLFELSRAADYAMGSGTRGRSYLVALDGHLYQSPISWYTQAGRWDVSPNYPAVRLFDRAITGECLFCHCNDAAPVEHTNNRYHKPPFRSHAIGCERCHGPGELHVRSRQGGEVPKAIDTTIVNPRHLEPALRDAVCEQCHLQGEIRVPRRGRGVFDYRPGLPLHLFWSVFVRRPELKDNKAVSHVEQMVVSRCYQASDGKMGCVSCHDPHALPEPARRADYYRERCLNCHGDRDCGLAPDVRRQERPDDNCAACHMSRRDSSDIAHTAVTDHRITRRPQPATRPALALKSGLPPIVPFHEHLIGGTDPELTRDLGVALADLGRQQPPIARPLGAMALSVLDSAERERPDDLAALEGKAFGLWSLGRARDALDVYQKVLAKVPGRERSLTEAAQAAALLGELETVTDCWERVVAINPWSTFAHTSLAEVLYRRGLWDRAVAACETAVRLNPSRDEPRRLLIRGLLRLDRHDRARAELDTLLGMKPDEAASLRGWFDEQARESKSESP